MSYVQYAKNIDEHTNDDQYDANANYDDVFDTKHVVQAIDDIHITTNPTYNNNYKLYYDDEYHDFNQISQKCVDNERVSTTHTQTQKKHCRTKKKKNVRKKSKATYNTCFNLEANHG